jgi:hypothetical protein
MLITFMSMLYLILTDFVIKHCRFNDISFTTWFCTCVQSRNFLLKTHSYYLSLKSCELSLFFS